MHSKSSNQVNPTSQGSDTCFYRLSKLSELGFLGLEDKAMSKVFLSEIVNYKKANFGQMYWISLNMITLSQITSQDSTYNIFKN